MEVIVLKFEKQLKDSKVDSVYRTDESFCILTVDGQVFPWGNKHKGGDDNEVRKYLKLKDSKVDSVYESNAAFCILTVDGEVFSWGDQYIVGDSREVRKQFKNSKVDSVCGSNGAFCILSVDGEVFSWGLEKDGGKIPVKIAEEMNNHKIVKMYSSKKSHLLL